MYENKSFYYTNSTYIQNESRHPCVNNHLKSYANLKRNFDKIFRIGKVTVFVKSTFSLQHFRNQYWKSSFIPTGDRLIVDETSGPFPLQPKNNFNRIKPVKVQFWNRGEITMINNPTDRKLVLVAYVSLYVIYSRKSKHSTLIKKRWKIGWKKVTLNST